MTKRRDVIRGRIRDVNVFYRGAEERGVGTVRWDAHQDVEWLYARAAALAEALRDVLTWAPKRNVATAKATAALAEWDHE